MILNVKSLISSEINHDVFSSAYLHAIAKLVYVPAATCTNNNKLLYYLCTYCIIIIILRVMP
jgi:hypothetical protein